MKENRNLCIVEYDREVINVRLTYATVPTGTQDMTTLQAKATNHTVSGASASGPHGLWCISFRTTRIVVHQLQDHAVSGASASGPHG